MTSEDWSHLAAMIDNEGLDYLVRHHGLPDGLDDARLLKLADAYERAGNKLEKYVEEMIAKHCDEEE